MTFGALVSAGCGSGAVDITAIARDGTRVHFNDVGCAVTYTGADSTISRGPSAIDVTCPAALRSPHGNPTLHISTPLVGKAGAWPLQDDHFRAPGYQLGQFIVISFVQKGQTLTCDPLKASGALVYTAVPVYGTPSRLSAALTPDAALLDCDAGSAPLQLQGSFDVEVPGGP